MKSSTSIILILVSIGLFYTFINPQYTNVKARRAEVEQYQLILSDLEQLAVKRDQLLAESQKIPATELQRIEKVLPDHVDTVKLALDFDSIAGKYGISIQNIETRTQSDSNNSTTIVHPSSLAPYEVARVSFTFIASYDNFRNFMNDIESSLRIIDIESISFTAGDDDLYEFDIDIATYWIK